MKKSPLDVAQARLLDEIAGGIAARMSSDDQNLSDIKAEFIAEVVQKFGEGTVLLPSREVIVSEIMWRAVDQRANNRGKRIIRDWLRGQVHICYESDFALMVRVSTGRRTTLGLYGPDDLQAYMDESASNRAVIVASDDELQAQGVPKMELLRQYGDIAGLHNAGLVLTFDEGVDEAAS